jgi:hypothetical protein
MTVPRRPAGAGLLRLYPRAWRDRYEAEMLAVLEQFELGPRGRLDLARGAIDARLLAPTRLPAAAALLAGGLWTVAGTGIVVQPAPPDWPGYLLELLPLAMVAVAAGALATIGCWARRRDGAGRMGTLAIGLTIAGHVLWLVALAAAFVGVGYGPVTAVAQDLGALGCFLVGFVLLRTGDERVGGLLILAPTLMMFGWPVAWLAFGLAWTLVGVLLLARPEPAAPSAPGFA